ncbi:MAG: gliding motility-associated C-terminal domain-containing protein, partial [Saprospiraceae bacterium]
MLKNVLPASLVCLSLLFVAKLSAQSNDECANATFLPQVENFCSLPAEGDNSLATASNLPVPGCFDSGDHDIWFSFVAIATQATIIIRGNTFDTPGGSLIRPSVALYAGTCTSLTELACKADQVNNNIIELSSGGLTPGETYYFRVDGFLPGTFQYCLRNYFFDGQLSGDCPTAVVVCDKMPFNVAAVAGPGNDPSELDDAPCFGGFFAESNTTWYVFTAASTGSLEFTLTPNNASDDLDFVVYRLPNGPGDCANKVVVRCMAAGDFSANSPCMGPTGLNTSSTAISKPAGCDPVGENNFLAPLNMIAGATYALAVNNFTSSGNGFQVDWGGTGTFTGPEAGFTTDVTGDSLCLGQAVIFTDTSSFSTGTFTSWRWNFGLGAQPDTADTAGPHTVRYTSAGQKIVSLTLQTSTGCQVTATHNLTVDTCCTLSAKADLVLECAADCPQATISVLNALSPVSYVWNGGQTDSLLSNLEPGDYAFTVTDATGCSDTASFNVSERVLFIPNAFTPNGDGVNDVFFPGGSGFEVLEMAVYSRWGQKVWSGVTGGWDGRVDGTPQASDVYAYRARVRFKEKIEE